MNADDAIDTATLVYEDRPMSAAKQLAVGSQTNLVPTNSEASAVINMIERAARDPAVDVEKLKQLMEMREQITKRQAEQEYDIAMSAAQAEMEPVRKDASNTQTRSKYATHGALDRAIRPIYTRHGFGLSFNTGDGAPPEHVRIICDVSHTGGAKRHHHLDMPADGKGAKGGDVMTKTHATMSATTYGMRGLLKMIFNVAVVDDDGNAAGNMNDPITSTQDDELKALIVSTGADLEKFLIAFQIESTSDLPAKRFEEAKTRLNNFARKAGRK